MNQIAAGTASSRASVIRFGRLRLSSSRREAGRDEIGRGAEAFGPGVISGTIARTGSGNGLRRASGTGARQPPRRVAAHQIEADLRKPLLQLVDAAGITDFDRRLLPRQRHQGELADGGNGPEM